MVGGVEFGVLSYCIWDICFLIFDVLYNWIADRSGVLSIDGTFAVFATRTLLALPS